MDRFYFFLTGVFVGGIFELILTDYGYTRSRYPTAIEVYQGKTTLEITYRDSIPVDSVVVYKE